VTTAPNRPDRSTLAAFVRRRSSSSERGDYEEKIAAQIGWERVIRGVKNWIPTEDSTTAELWVMKSAFVV
jgi:hypothetical protein